MAVEKLGYKNVDELKKLKPIILMGAVEKTKHTGQASYRANLLVLIYHSDKGIQYCSNRYVNEIKKRENKISMNEENYCYEN